jgi:hypothetical protein
VSRQAHYFNNNLAKPAGIEPVSAPVGDLQIEPSPNEGQYRLSPKVKELLVDAKYLNFDAKWERFSDADKKTPQWRDRVERLLNHIDRWYPQDEVNAADYTTLYLTPMHAARETLTLLIANIRNALSHVRTVAEQFPAADRRLSGRSNGCAGDRTAYSRFDCPIHQWRHCW